MKTLFATTALAGVLALAPLALPVQGYLGGSARAAEAAVGPAVGKPLKEAQDLSKAGNYAAALKKVKEANALPGKTAYESFVIDEFTTFINVKLKDYGAAAQSAEAALDTGQAPAKERAQRLKTLVQLNYSVKNYGKAIGFAGQYRQEAGADPEIEQLVVQAYYQQGDYANAAAAAKGLAASARAAGRKPDETVLQVWLSSAFKQGDAKGQREALTALVESYPSPAYKGDLMNLVEADLGKSDRMSLEVFRLKLAAGTLKSSDDYVEMAQLALQLGLPGEAESVMRHGFDAGVLGGPNRSREQRLEAMAKSQAAQDEPTLARTAPTTPKTKAALAEAYATYGKPDKAIALYREALASAFPEADLARLHLGQALLAKGDAAAAAKAFRSVRDPKLAELANLWIVLPK